MVDLTEKDFRPAAKAKRIIEKFTEIDAALGQGLPAGVQGDVLYHNGADWTALSPGTDGQHLRTQGAGANPLWEDVAAGGGDSLWLFGAHYEAGDSGDAMEPNGGPISGGPVGIPTFDDLAVIQAPYNLTINRLETISNQGDNTTGFGFFFGLGAGVQQGSDFLYSGGVTRLNTTLTLAVPVGTFVGLRWTVGTLPQFTGSRVYWTKD